MNITREYDTTALDKAGRPCAGCRSAPHCTAQCDRWQRWVRPVLANVHRQYEQCRQKLAQDASAAAEAAESGQDAV